MTYNEVVAMVQPWALNGTGITAEDYAIGMDKYGDILLSLSFPLLLLLPS
jgi:hypothetical protein